MLGAIFAFLIFNWEPSEVFMGDTGALVIGMMLAILAIHFINVNYNLPVMTPYRFTGLGWYCCLYYHYSIGGHATDCNPEVIEKTKPIHAG